MSFAEDSRLFAPATRASSVLVEEIQQPVVDQWTVVGRDRIAGTAYHRPGVSDGKTVITSPVVEVRFMGPMLAPVAFTASGSVYWLGQPSDSFGLDRAEKFVWDKSRRPQAARGDTLPQDLRTQTLHVSK